MAGKSANYWSCYKYALLGFISQLADLPRIEPERVSPGNKTYLEDKNYNFIIVAPFL